MPLVQEAYKKIFGNFGRWSQLSQSQKITTMYNASSLIGRPFLQALCLLEDQPEKVQITQYEQMISIYINGNKQIIFKQGKTRHCTCQHHWKISTKDAQSTTLMCLHEITYQLWHKIFKKVDPITERLENSNNNETLMQLLSMI